MRSFLLLLVAGLILTASVGPDELRVAYGRYTPRDAASFRAEARMVETPVVVRDDHGKTIDLLQQQDFRILDSGKERDITSFQVQRAHGGVTESAPPRLIALVFDDIPLKLSCDSMNVRPDPEPSPPSC
jgi:hypothetical protein